MLLRFGPNELNPASFELRRSRRRIPLATRPMELLLLLVQRRGELMTREEIARSLWPGVDVEDLTARINTTIAQIRGALDDDASSAAAQQAAAHRAPGCSGSGCFGRVPHLDRRRSRLFQTRETEIARRRSLDRPASDRER
jgi:hypothetical protein